MVRSLLHIGEATMTAEKYVERVNAFIVPYLAKNGFALIRTDFVSEDHNWFLRLYIDLTEQELEKRKAEAEAEAAEAGAAEDIPAEEDAQEEAEGPSVPGVSINDCVKVSRYLSKWLDKEDFIKESYTMEVCSKGFLEQPSAPETEEGDDK